MHFPTNRYDSSSSDSDEVIVYDDIYPKRVPGTVRNQEWKSPSSSAAAAAAAAASAEQERLARARARQRLREYRRLRARQRARRRKDLQVRRM